MTLPETSPTPNIKKGIEVIRQALNSISNEAGVYRMLDMRGNVLYVGKAKHLKNRVSNYANVTQLPYRLQRMVMHTAKVEVVTTRSEAEALLVEANFVKQYRPRYNILLKDDKSYPYIYFSGNHPFPRISKYRGAQDKPGVYLGPFVSARAVDEMLKILQKVFLLRPCSDTIFKNRSRPCLQYQIKRCSAPCVNYIDEEAYANNVEASMQFLKGNTDDIRRSMNEEMQRLSEQMRFEKAAELRDRLKALTHIQQQQSLALKSLKNADILVVVRERDVVCVQLFSYRYGSNFGNHSFFPENTSEISDAEILETFIATHYQQHPTPDQVVLSHDVQDASMIEEALFLCGGKKVDIIVPKRGEKLEAVNLAIANTRDTLRRHISEQAVNEELLEHMIRVFHLPKKPERIEVYDNSHISGTNAIGAMIVATPKGFDKKSYRTFNIRTQDLAPGDDYGMMREVFSRRMKRLSEEDATLPDLLLIDGGTGQLSSVMEVMNSYSFPRKEEVGREAFPEQSLSLLQECPPPNPLPMGEGVIPIVAISKGEDRNAGREWFHLPGQQPFQLPINDPLLHYLQRLRDEAHRFAIGTHRNKRSKVIVTSELDTMTGIGPKRKKALLTHFGSVRAIRGASIDEIAKVEGISHKVAEEIYRYFH